MSNAAAPDVAFGKTETSTPLKPTGSLLTTDAMIRNILNASRGGDSTAQYFEQYQVVRQLYKELATKGDAAWVEGKDLDGNPVHTISILDSKGEACYMKLAVEGLRIDDQGNVVGQGSKFPVNGVEYESMAMATHTVGYSNFEFSKSSRTIGYLVGPGGVAIKLLPYVWRALKVLGRAIARGVQAIWGLVAEGGAAAEAAAVDAAEAGENALIGEGVAVGEGAVEGSAIAAGAIFIGAVIVIALVFIAIAYILHNSYHDLRIWNITKYNMDWSYHIDTQAGINEGKIIKGPGTYKGNKIVPERILGASAKGVIPGVQGTPHLTYGDISVVSSHEYNGIGYVIQLFLKDPKTNEQVYELTTYYDIPFEGKNSTNLTFDHVDNVGRWYDRNSGNNRKTYAETWSVDKVLKASTNYDFLEGQHPVPGQEQGSSNNAFYYRSVLCVLDPALKVDDIK